MAKSAIESLSPTKVDTYSGCKRLFLYRFLNPPFTPPENKYFLIGNVAHKVLENLHKQHMASAVVSWSDAMRDNFKDAVKTYNVYRKIEEGLISKADLLSIKEMLQKYLHYVKRSMPKVQRVEELHKINIRGIPVWLKSDRIDLSGKNSYCVVDYKSGKPASHKDETESVQIPSYGLLVRSLHGKNARVSGKYLYLKFLDKPSGVHSHDITDAWITQAEDRYLRVYDELHKNKCGFTQNFKYKYCWGCDYKRHCVNDHNDGFEI